MLCATAAVGVLKARVISIGTDSRSSIVFSVPSLSSGEQYVGPDPQFATDCRCNTVFYSMLAACSACQDAEYIGWTMYSANCSSVAIEEFPRDIPGGTRIPHWAYQDVVVRRHLQAVS